MILPRRLWALLVLGGLAASAIAQPLSLRGRVVDAADGRALPGASVHLEHGDGTRYGTATTAEGTFLFPRLASGRYALRVTFVGYRLFADTVVVATGVEPLAVALQAEAVPVGEVTVRDAARREEPTEGRLVTVRPADVDNLPTLTPAPDLAAYLTTLPAFTPTGDRGGQVSVRGGEPTQNLFLVDGIPIYQPFHSLSEFTVVPGDALAVAEVYAGAFPARYGGRIASVVEVALRSGNKRRVKASVSAAPLLSAVQVEGPILPGRVSALVSVRESFADRVGLGLGGATHPFAFGDRLGKLHAYLTQTSTLSATVLSSHDRATLGTSTGADGQARWTTHAGGVRFSYLPRAFAVLAEIEVFGSRLDSYFTVPKQPSRRSLVEEGGGMFGFRYLVGRNEVRFGVQARTNHLLTAGDISGEEYLTEGAFYLDGAFRAGALRVDPGLRVGTFPSRSRVVLEPRLRVEWTRGPHHVHAGMAVVHQEIGGRYTSGDLTDVFVAWVPTPPGAPLPRAEQFVAGWSAGSGRGRVRVDAYRRGLQNVGPGGVLSGRAQGVEGMAEGGTGRFGVQVGGAWQSVRYRRAGGDVFPPPADRPVRLDAQVQYGHAGVTAAARWYYTDGTPFTPVRGVYYDVPLTVGSDAHLQLPGRLRTVDGAAGSRRLPPTHRLDVMLSYHRALGPLRFTGQVALRNAYDRANVFYLNRVTGERYDALRRVIAVGLRVDL